ncbi:MAG: O-antigen ligase family protein [Bdellovibrionales bacterium]|nr:O-antigen ligase family protein [Bdellovibrionales bacterium]
MTEDGGDSGAGSLKALLFGFLVPLLTIFGPGTALILAIVFALSEKRRWTLGDLIWAAPLLSLLAASYCAEVFFEKLAFLPNFGTFDWVGLENLLRFALVPILFKIFSDSASARESALKGMAAALPVAALVGYLQKNGTLTSLMLPNQTYYWDSLGRYTSTFSDPNAAGIFLILLLPFIVNGFTSQNRFGTILYLLALCCLLYSASLTGSRSFILGAALYLFLFCYSHSRKATLLLTLIGFCSVGLLDYLRMYQIDSYQSTLLMLPEAARRGLDAISFLNIAQTFHTRLVFWKIGIEIWQDNPLFGVGFDRFAEWAPFYSLQLNHNLGAWTDNSNNFYIGLLAETGIIGLGLFLLALAALHVRPSSPEDHEQNYLSPAIFSLSCLVILLFFGPHLVFDEVSILTAIVMAACLNVEHSRIRLSSTIILSIAAAAGAAWQASSGEYGFYTWEKSSNGEFFRWSTQQSTGSLDCSPETHHAELLLRAANPDLSRRPLRVTIHGPSQGVELKLTSPEINKVVLTCGSAPKVRYWIETSRSWKPSLHSNTLDNRELGLQVLNSFEQVY